MGEDTPKFKRPYTEGDTKRASSRHRTPKGGVPFTVEIDPELTPPPSEPPRLIDATGDDRFSQIQDYLGELHGKLERVWDSRHSSDRIEFLQKDVATLLSSYNEFMVPAVRSLMARTATVETSLMERGKVENTFYNFEWPSFKKSIEQIGSNVDRVQKDVDRVESGFANFLKQYDGHRTHSDERYKELKDKDQQQEQRLRKLEDFTLEWKVKVMMISTGFSGLVAVLVWLAEHFTK